MIIHSIVPFPAEILAVCAGAVFGALVGSILIWVGAMIGALLAFGLARKLGRRLIEKILSEQNRKALDRWSSDQGALALLMSRFIPLIAFNLINYAAGLTNIRVWTFIWTTGLGIIPVTVLSAYLGAQMKNLEWGTLLVLSGLGIFVIWIGSKVARNQGWIS